MFRGAGERSRRSVRLRLYERQTFVVRSPRRDDACGDSDADRVRHRCRAPLSGHLLHPCVRAVVSTVAAISRRVASSDRTRAGPIRRRLSRCDDAVRPQRIRRFGRRRALGVGADHGDDPRPRARVACGRASRASFPGRTFIGRMVRALAANHVSRCIRRSLVDRARSRRLPRFYGTRSRDPSAPKFLPRSERPVAHATLRSSRYIDVARSRTIRGPQAGWTICVVRSRVQSARARRSTAKALRSRDGRRRSIRRRLLGSALRPLGDRATHVARYRPEAGGQTQRLRRDEDTFHLESSVARFATTLRSLGSDARVTIAAHRNHWSIFDESDGLIARIVREASEANARGS